MRGIKLLLLSLLILLPFGELLRFNIGNNIYVKPLDIAACLLTLWLCIWLLYTKKFTQVFKWQLLLFPLVGLVSLAINSFQLSANEFVASSLYLLRWIGYLGVLFAVLQTDAGFKEIAAKVLLADGIVVVVIGYLQYLFYSDIRHLVNIGWDDHMHRLFSTFYDPNFAGAFLVLFTFYISSFIYQSIKEKKRNKSLLLAILLFATLLAVLLTFSRSALLMLIFGGITLLVFFKQKKLILALIGLLAAYVIIVSPVFYIENTNLFRAASTGARLETYGNAFTIYRDHPILGIGFNAYRYVQQDYGFRKEQPKYPSNADSGVDNSLLFVLATTGIVGFAAFLLMWETLISNAVQHFKKNGNLYAGVFIASALGLFINSLFINSLFFPPLVLWMWMLFGIIHQKD